MVEILDLIGNTPLVRLKRMTANPEVDIFAKLEGQNPGGSVKDRPALFMVRGAMVRGVLKPGDTLVEATSGNTGIGLAMIGPLFGVQVELVMPENANRERLLTMRAFGAKITLTPVDEGIEGARDRARYLAEQEGCFLPDQFSNPDNPAAHFKTTGPEIWRQSGKKVTHFISAMGTTGTITGVGRYLKQQSSNVNVIGVQPAGGASIPGIRKWPDAYLPSIYQPSVVDRIIEVTGQQAAETARNLALQEGVFAGLSSGGALFAAIRLSQEIEQGKIVCIVCDRGDRYLSLGIAE